MKRIPVWVWFFIVLTVLTAAAITVEIWYNLSQQLTPQQVEAAQTLWQEHAPSEYEVEYTLSWQTREPVRYEAIIRNREIAAITVDGRELEPVLYPLHDLPPLFDAVAAWLADDLSRGDGTVNVTAAEKGSATYRVEMHDGQTVVKRNGVALAKPLATNYLPPAQFHAFARQLEIDRQPGAERVYCVASFDRRTGMPLRYVRSVSATRERVQIAVNEGGRP